MSSVALPNENNELNDGDESTPDFEIGSVIVFDLEEDTFYVPGTGLKKVPILPADAFSSHESLKLMAEDHVQTMEVPTAVATQEANFFSSNHTIPTTAGAQAELEHRGRGRPPNSRIDSVTPSFSMHSVSEPVIKRKLGRSPIGSKQRPLSRVADRKPRSASRAEARSKDSSYRFKRSLSRDSNDTVCLPVRYSMRVFRNEHLRDAEFELDDDLGIGLDDDANQRRSWHKPRVKPKMILEHKFQGCKIIYKIQQSAGNCEWIDEELEEVPNQLKLEYKQRRNLSDEDLIPKKRPKTSVGHRCVSTLYSSEPG